MPWVTHTIPAQHAAFGREFYAAARPPSALRTGANGLLSNRGTPSTRMVGIASPPLAGFFWRFFSRLNERHSAVARVPVAGADLFLRFLAPIGCERNDQHHRSVASLGCGPAAEVFDLADCLAQVKYTLIDVDNRYVEQGGCLRLGLSSTPLKANIIKMALKDRGQIPGAQAAFYSLGVLTTSTTISWRVFFTGSMTNSQLAEGCCWEIFAQTIQMLHYFVTRWIGR